VTPGSGLAADVQVFLESLNNVEFLRVRLVWLPS
jgi:hypothetical protein